MVPKVSHWILLLRVFEVRSVAAQRSIFLNFLKEKYQTRAVFSAKLPSLFGVKNKQTNKRTQPFHTQSSSLCLAVMFVLTCMLLLFSSGCWMTQLLCRTFR